MRCCAWAQFKTPSRLRCARGLVSWAKFETPAVVPAIEKSGYGSSGLLGAGVSASVHAGDGLRNRWNRWRGLKRLGHAGDRLRHSGNGRFRCQLVR